jgi:hypothetical protein
MNDFEKVRLEIQKASFSNYIKEELLKQVYLQETLELAVTQVRQLRFKTEDNSKKMRFKKTNGEKQK